MTDADDVLRTTRTVLVVDWPSAEVPEALARAGFDVIVHGGPGPEDYTEYRADGGELVIRRLGRPPGQADLVYVHRPVAELPAIVETARDLGARAVWVQSGLAAEGAKDPTGCWLSPEQSQEARAVVESAGLAYVDDRYIVEVAGRLSG